jgi:hypothetical protein
MISPIPNIRSNQTPAERVLAVSNLDPNHHTKSRIQADAVLAWWAVSALEDAFRLLWENASPEDQHRIRTNYTCLGTLTHAPVCDKPVSSVPARVAELADAEALGASVLTT